MGRRKQNDPNQLNLLDLIQQQETTLAGRSTDEPGGLNMTSAVRHALYEAIRESGLSRWQIAAKMSELTDCEISKFMLDAWTSESKDGHRFPMEFAPAFCQATSNNGPIEVICRPVGMYALDGPDALRSQLHRLAEERKKLQSQEREMQQLLQIFETHK
jgi:hypothetical protein